MREIKWRDLWLTIKIMSNTVECVVIRFLESCTIQRGPVMSLLFRIAIFFRRWLRLWKLLVVIFLFAETIGGLFSKREPVGGQLAVSLDGLKFAFEPFKLFGTRSYLSWQIRHNFGAWKIKRTRFPEFKMAKSALRPRNYLTRRGFFCSRREFLHRALASKQKYLNKYWLGYCIH